jgi:hypothetical protein
VLAEAEKRRAKVVLVGDPEQLQAIEAGAAFRSIAERHGAVEITQVRRQREDWQRDATRHLATGRTGEALAAYEQAGYVHAADTREAARTDLIERWDKDRHANPDASRIILTHTNDEVRALNEAARVRLRASDQLGRDVTLNVERGSRDFAAGDRIMFLKNERSMGVKNGSLGTIRSVSPIGMVVMLDDGRAVVFDLKDYNQVDHGYAATIHKAQGMTVDRVHVLATPGLDRHAAYVALSRHRDSVDLHYGSDDFADRTRLVCTLGRDRGKDMVADYNRTADGDQSQQRRRSMFDGLELKPQTKALPERDGARAAAPTPSHVRGMTPDRKALDTSPAGEERPSPPPDLAPAVERHGKIVSAMRFARSVGEPYTPDQRLELAQSRAALDALRPDACRDLEQAMVNAPRLITEAAQGKTQAALRAMQLEAEMRTDPVLRADVFVQRWQALDRQRRSLLKDHESSRANRMAETMIGMARSLERDPQLESLLRQRRSQLGLPELPMRSMGQSLADMVGRGRSRGIEIGM